MTTAPPLAALTWAEALANALAQLFDADWCPLEWKPHAARACAEVGVELADLKAAKERLDAGRVRKPSPTLHLRPEPVMTNGNAFPSRAEPVPPEVERDRKIAASVRAHGVNGVKNPLPGIRRCASCKLTLPASSFGWRDPVTERLDSYCKSCRADRNTASRARQRALRCARCGRDAGEHTCPDGGRMVAEKESPGGALTPRGMARPTKEDVQ